MRWFVWLFAAAASFAASSIPGFRLPDTVVPLRYNVTLSIDPNKDVFDGTVLVAVDVEKPTSTIWLNAKDLEVRSAAVAGALGPYREARVRSVNKELIEVNIGAPVSGAWTLRLEYRARLDDKAVVGAYRRKVDGNWYMYTTFTPIEARRAIPCFDEPRFKAPWQLSITVPQGEFAFSNGAETSRSSSAGQTTFQFAETKPLPSELVAFAVGPFDVYQGKPAGHGTPIRAITPKDEAAEGKAAADTTVAILPRLEAYTGMPYAFGKLDHLALADAAFGAVENPGLITYLAREMLMLPGSETISRTRALHLLEAHELGHQWFGDLVTQATWADTWLSEGFATWISEKIIDQEDKPERTHLGLIEARERIMGTDASRHSRPVRVEPHDRDGTRDIYNRFIYNKGASVLMMLEAWLGEDKFRDGIRGYLRDHQFGNASTADLAAELKKATGTDPAAVMHAFLDETGVPRVTVQVECTGTPRLRLRETGATAIPVCYRGMGVNRACTVMNGPTEEIDLPKNSGCPSWVEPNAGGTGYFRTAWTPMQLTALSLKDLTPAERLTLAFDLRVLPADRTVTRAVLTRLASDPEPEVARAAQDTLEPPSGRGSTR